jgi:exopolyphosphatase / guanosine-5'-triphosphate,3'-diphosphate pyrophosphatase
MTDTKYELLAAVDLGSNSFKLQVARVVQNQLYMLDALKEPVRLAAGLTAEKRLDKESRQRALDCLTRFGDRLKGFERATVRCVGTSALRQAKDAPSFLDDAEAALGFPIEIIAGREEARLIYVGVAHSLPASKDQRLVVDIGGGSTECIVGKGMKPVIMESLNMGCVNFSQRYFPNGRIEKAAMKQAILAAMTGAQSIAAPYQGQWSEAVGSSGTARALADVLGMNGLSDGCITAEGLEGLRELMLHAGHVQALNLAGLKSDRLPVIAGGFAIMSGVFAELGIKRMTPAIGALREGILYDQLGRFHHADMRQSTVSEFARRYHVDAVQAERVRSLALSLFEQIRPLIENDAETARLFLDWAARLHEIGISIAHASYHKHGAYILENADMPGFSKSDQARLALLVRAQRGGLAKVPALMPEAVEPVTQDDLLLIQILRLAVLFHRSRLDAALPEMVLQCQGKGCKLALPSDWLEQNLLARTELEEEEDDWKGMRLAFRLKSAA